VKGLIDGKQLKGGLGMYYSELKLKYKGIRARFRELWKLLSDGRDQAGLSLHSLVIGHCATRIADFEVWTSSLERQHSSSSLTTLLIRVLTG
jgi:hypothetical protein